MRRIHKNRWNRRIKISRKRNVKTRRKRMKGPKRERAGIVKCCNKYIR